MEVSGAMKKQCDKPMCEDKAICFSEDCPLKERPLDRLVMPGVWCCEHRAKCKWQGFALHQGLSWGAIPEHGQWREWHNRECGGRLIQLIDKA